jgi:hypothetical protein
MTLRGVTMGTAREWMHVMIIDLIWGVFMTCYVAGRKPAIGLSKIARGYLIYGLSFGILISFGWQRAFRIPVVFVTIPSMAYGLFTLWSAKLEWAAKIKEGVAGQRIVT